MALKPQDPRQGSLHFSLIQALLLGHSELIKHSGRQLGGDPMYVAKHEHEGDPLREWTTRRWIARIMVYILFRRYDGCYTNILIIIERAQMNGNNLTWLGITSSEWITSVTIHAIANGTMVVYSTFSILATSIWTRINAFLV
jgi:hypothetical protein